MSGIKSWHLRCLSAEKVSPRKREQPLREAAAAAPLRNIHEDAGYDEIFIGLVGDNQRGTYFLPASACPLLLLAPTSCQETSQAMLRLVGNDPLQVREMAIKATSSSRPE